MQQISSALAAPVKEMTTMQSHIPTVARKAAPSDISRIPLVLRQEQSLNSYRAGFLTRTYHLQPHRAALVVDLLFAEAR